MPPLNECLLLTLTGGLPAGDSRTSHQNGADNRHNGREDPPDLEMNNNIMENGNGHHRRQQRRRRSTTTKMGRSPKKFLVYPVIEEKLLELNGIVGKKMEDMNGSEKMKAKLEQLEMNGAEATKLEKINGINGQKKFEVRKAKLAINGEAEEKMEQNGNGKMKTDLEQLVEMNHVGMEEQQEKLEMEQRIPPVMASEEERTKAAGDDHDDDGHVLNGIVCQNGHSDHQNGYQHDDHKADWDTLSSLQTLAEIQTIDDLWAAIENDQIPTLPKKISIPETPRKISSSKTSRRREEAVQAVAEQAGGTERWAGMRRAKVIMLGESGVGKTSICLAHRFCTMLNGGDNGPPGPAGLFPCNATIGASYTNFDLTVLNNCSIQMQLWDTAGQERFRCMVPMYIRNASAAILVYDITSRESFDGIDRWHHELSKYPRGADEIEPIVVLIGNKADQQAQREVAEDEGLAKALRFKARYFFEISAANTEVIRSIFNSLAEQIVRKWACVESALEADEEMSQDGDNASIGSASPVIRLGWTAADDELSGSWARPQMSCSSSWSAAAEDGGTATEFKAEQDGWQLKSGACCGAI